MTRRATAAAVLIMLLVGAVFAVPALAARAEPSLIGQAWYWEPQQNQNIDTPVGSVSGEAPNPFCPGLPSSLGAPQETCAEGRIPVEVVNGDYETPDKVSALAFDLTMLTLGSKVSKFTVTLLEAESGCRENPDTTAKQKCEETDARNPEGKVIVACEVGEIFGDGDARQYKEMPKYDCAGAPEGVRKEIENDAEADPTDPDADHQWTFDLTALAKSWTETPPLCTCIMLRPKAPKDAEDDDPNWRVVFTGPKVEKGVVTELVFTPGEGESLPPIETIPPTDPGISSGTGGTSSFGSTSVGGGLDSGSTGDLGGSGTTTPAGGDSAAPEDVPPGEDTALTNAKGPEVEAMPGYVWMAILAGLIGFSMVRSIVLENTHSHRPNGVLAHIHRINAARGGMQGAAAAAAVAGPLSGLKSGLATIGSSIKPVTGKVTSLFRKIPGIKKG
ncbi:MAG: hypothetical protein ACLGIB_05510 [Actinomycetota bacterium]